MADLVTLSGDYDYPLTRRQSVSIREGELEELMGASFLDFLKSTGSLIASPVTSLAKGTGKTFMEFGRAVKTGDPLRFVAAPFKGTTYTFKSQYRDIKENVEWYWRPSKMSVWMQPVGSALTAAGTVPSPASPFLLAGGIALTTAGGIGSAIYAKDKARKAKTAEEAADIERKAKQKNMLYWTVAALGVGVLAVTLT